MVRVPGAAPLNVAWVSRTVNRLAEAAAAHGWSEIEVNPAVLSPEGGTIVDALAQCPPPSSPVDGPSRQ